MHSAIGGRFTNATFHSRLSYQVMQLSASDAIPASLAAHIAFADVKGPLVRLDQARFSTRVVLGEPTVLCAISSSTVVISRPSPMTSSEPSSTFSNTLQPIQHEAHARLPPATLTDAATVSLGMSNSMASNNQACLCFHLKGVTGRTVSHRIGIDQSEHHRAVLRIFKIWQKVHYGLIISTLDK